MKYKIVPIESFEFKKYTGKVYDITVDQLHSYCVKSDKKNIIVSNSICITRVQTGHGIPQITAIQKIFNIKQEYGLKCAIIADGGIRNSGDIVKALAFGSDFVMLGSMLSGTDEAPGEIINIDNKKQGKVYRGMASKEAQNDWKGSYSSFEGVNSIVSLKGSVKNILDDLVRGIKSGLSYSGVTSIEQLRNEFNYVIQTYAGQIESSAHIKNISLI